jgi:DNA-binding beta-propeller fold protein YncE/ABC-type molybdate transport system permease subunit
VERLGRTGRILGAVMSVTILAAMLLPGSLIGAALMKVRIGLDLASTAGRGWWILSAAQAARFAGVALIVLRVARDAQDPHFEEMAQLDGAGRWDTWWHVRWPRTWPLLAGGWVLVVMLSLTEVPATGLLVPPGVPSFSQRLLDQMHHARDQDVIATCLGLLAVYLVLIAPVVFLLVLRRGRGALACLLGLAMVAGLSGCRDAGAAGPEPQVVRIIGASGRGPGEFLYPRALDLDAAGNLYVVDRTGRIQHLTPEGKVLGVLELPAYDKGYPTGVTVGPDGNVLVADTHNSRVLVYDGRGRVVREFGRFGTEGGQFIFPTDVAVGPDGRLYVSEYGGNDRVSVFTPEGEFLSAFGRPGGGEGELMRPAALAADAARGVLYVADACNHRIARYTFDGELIGYFGTLGAGPGELKYPYGLALAADGSLVVCEFGNNRIQVFSPGGESLRRLGEAGRRAGQLAYPWSAAADASHFYVVDSGNNRIQVWKR